jgi:DNA-binding MarR family transcriptional regulator
MVTMADSISPDTATSEARVPEGGSADPQAPRMRAWRAFLYAHAAVMRELEAQLVAERGMTLAEYDALVQLASAPGARLRMSDLAARVLLSRSGVTRLVDRLERQGLARREICGSDARGAYAALTPLGVRRLREAMPVHLRGIDQVFGDVMDGDDALAIERVMAAVAAAAAGHPIPGDSARSRRPALGDTTDA